MTTAKGFDRCQIDLFLFIDMVVSGLPIRNGDLHAGEIATIALDVISSMVGFKIKHMEGKTLELRVGIHSGKLLTPTLHPHLLHPLLILV